MFNHKYVMIAVLIVEEDKARIEFLMKNRDCEFYRCLLFQSCK